MSIEQLTEQLLKENPDISRADINAAVSQFLGALKATLAKNTDISKLNITVTAPKKKLRVLSQQLRDARNKIGMTVDEAAAHLEWSSSKLTRIETGQVGVSVVDAKALTSLYKLPSAVTTEITKLARDTYGRRGS